MAKCITLQTETMHKCNTTRRKLCVICCLITCQQNGGGGEEGGAYSRGALILNFGQWEGRLFEGGAYSRGGEAR